MIKKIVKVLTLFLLLTIIFGANIILLAPLFKGGYTQHIGSIESVFIADARFIFENFPHLSWQPYWYAGFPFHLFYTPLLPFSMAFLHRLFPAMAITSWYRILIGLFYALTPVSLYCLVRYLTGKSQVGFFAALAYSFLPSVGFLVPQAGGLSQAYGGIPWQILTLILYGEGPHFIALFFLPLALLFFLRAMRKFSWLNVFLASFLTGLLILTNMIALVSLGVMLAIVLIVELVNNKVWPNKLGLVILLALMSYGLVAFWLNFSFLQASLSIGSGGASGSVGDFYLRLIPLLFLIAPAFFLLAILGKRKSLRPLFIGLGWIFIFFLSNYLWFKGTMILPQPNRYLPEMNMGIALFVSWSLFLLLEKIIPRNWRWLSNAFYILLAILIFYFPLRYVNQVWELTQPHQEIENTSEYRVASWLEENSQGERVYASGTTAFWLNVFTNIPQVRGGNDGVPNPWVLHAIYQINTAENAPQGEEGKVAAWWLRAYNAHYLVVNLPSSGEKFHDFRYPERFDQAEGLEKQIDLNGDVIYKVNLNQPSLAQVVKQVDFDSLVEPENAVDVDNLEKYVNYIDGPENGEAEFIWTGMGRAKIKAELEENEGVAIQITHDPGWKAFVGGKRILVKNDIIGFIFLDPKKTGQVEIDLVYGWAPDVWLGYFLTFLALVGLFIYPKLHRRGSKLFKSAKKEWEKE